MSWTGKNEQAMLAFDYHSAKLSETLEKALVEEITKGRSDDWWDNALRMMNVEMNFHQVELDKNKFLSKGTKYLQFTNVAKGYSTDIVGTNSEGHPL